MRYRFNVFGGDCAYFDDVGQPFGSPEAAEAHGATIAKELAADATYAGLEVRVVDGRAREVARIPIACALAGDASEPN